MLFLDLAAKAVRGFSPSLHTPLKGGYVCLSSSTDSPAPLTRLILALCYRTHIDASFLPPAAHAELTLRGDDGEIWRVMYAGGIHQFNQATRQFLALTEDASEIRRLLHTQAGFPPETVYRKIFTLTADQLPPQDISTNTAAQRSTAKLQAELDAAKAVTQLEFHYNELQSNLFETEEIIKKHESLKAQLHTIRQELALSPTPQKLGLPEDVVARVRGFPQAQKRYEQAVELLNSEREQHLVTSNVLFIPIHKNKNFLGLVFLGLAFLVAGGNLEGTLRSMALLSILFFGGAAFVALRFVDLLQRRGLEAIKEANFAAQEKRLHEEFAANSALVRTAYEKAGAVTRDAFEEAMARKEALIPQAAALELECAEFELDCEPEKVKAEAARLKDEMLQVQRRLEASAGSYMRSPQEIERDLAALERVSHPQETASHSESVGVLEDSISEVLQLSAKYLFATDMPTLWKTLQKRVMYYFTELTALDCQGVNWTTVQLSGQTVPINSLAWKDGALFYVSVRMAILETCSAQTKRPVLIEDVVDLPKQAVFNQMLKNLGTLTQVLHVTAQSSASQESIRI